MKNLRVDLVFSYWVFAWFILYVCKIISFSPKFAIILGLIDNAIMLILMLIYTKNRYTILYFIIINSFIKIIPFYYLRNETIKFKDIYFTIALFCVFVIWLHINKQSLTGNLQLIYNSILYGHNKTPFIAFINKFQNNFTQLKY